MAYNLTSFIRKVPRNDFKEYLTTKYPTLDFDDDFLKLKKNKTFKITDKKYIDYITSIIQSLTDLQQINLHNDCELAYTITQDAIAINALNDAIELNKTTTGEIINTERQSPQATALIVQQSNPEIIELAIKYYSLDKYSHGLKHSQYHVEDGFTFKQGEETKDSFETAINQEVNKKNIITLKTKTDWVERELESGEVVQQIVFYREKQPTAVHRFNENDIETDFVLFVSEGAIRFNHRTGAIDITGEGGKEFHDSIKKHFQTIIIEQSEEKQISKIEPKNINFDVFNTKPNFEPYYKGFFKIVEVESIKLIDGKESYLISNKKDDRDVYKSLYKFSKVDDVAKTQYKTSKVTIRCIIQANESDKEEIVSFDLTYPNKSSLPNQHSKYQKPIEELLVKMKIVEK